MMRQFLTFLLLFTLISFSVQAQNKEAVKATKTGFLDKPTIVPSIAKQIQAGTFKGVDPN
ncbi:MAG: hypothetical protein GQ527_04470 [Bacteroidales bacterium]|nr:hypothetical protein [Bacteroidales bacterium]